MTNSHNPDQKRGQPNNKGSWVAEEKSDPEATLEVPAPKSARLPTGPYRPGTIAGYELKNVKTLNIGREGGAYTASVYRDGKRVMTVENRGDGGADWFDRVAGVDYHAEMAALEATVKDVHGDEGYNEPGYFLSLVAAAGDYQKHAKKNGWTYAQVAEPSVKRDPYLDEESKAILLNPERFSDDYVAPESSS